MDLPIDDEELETVVMQLWKSRSEKNCGAVYEKLKLVKEVRDANPDGPYKKILREEHGMVI
jgi:hypothetical protein